MIDRSPLHHPLIGWLAYDVPFKRYQGQITFWGAPVNVFLSLNSDEDSDSDVVGFQLAADTIPIFHKIVPVVLHYAAQRSWRLISDYLLQSDDAPRSTAECEKWLELGAVTFLPNGGIHWWFNNPCMQLEILVVTTSDYACTDWGLCP